MKQCPFLQYFLLQNEHKLCIRLCCDRKRRLAIGRDGGLPSRRRRAVLGTGIAAG